MSQQPKTFALGLGLTNECNLTCSFCYRDPNRVDRLTLDQVQQVMNSLPVHSVNLGTGENGMHPDFLPILDFLRSQSIKLTITSNGHSIAVPDDEQLCAFHDVEFSLDYPTEEEQDRQRGSGNWRLIHEQAARCGPMSTLEALGEDIVKTAPFFAARMVPEFCEACDSRDVCHGGCAGRRMLQGRIVEPDFYCPITRGDRPQLKIRMAPARDLPKLGSACTTVVIARN